MSENEKLIERLKDALLDINDKGRVGLSGKLLSQAISALKSPTKVSLEKFLRTEVSPFEGDFSWYAAAHDELSRQCKESETGRFTSINDIVTAAINSYKKAVLDAADVKWE